MMIAATTPAGGAGLPGCGPEGGGCAGVLLSPYSRLLGLSLTIYALAFYGFFAVLVVLVGVGGRATGRPFGLVLPVAAAPAVAVAVWAVLVMVVVLESVCIWCLTVHGINGLLMVTVVIYAWQDWKRSPPRKVAPVVLSALGTLAVGGAAFAFVSFAHDRPSVEEVPLPPGMFERLTIDAERIQTSSTTLTPGRRVVVFACPTCPTCRRLHKILRDVAEETGGRLRIDYRYYPLEASCNRTIDREKSSGRHRAACELSRTQLAVALIAPSIYPSLMAEMYARQSDLTPAAAARLARDRIGAARYDAGISDAAVSQRLEEDVNLADELNVSSVPKVVVPAGVLSGDLTTQSLRRYLLRYVLGN